MGKQAKRQRKEQESALPGKDGELTTADKRFASTLNYLARGIVIGGSLAYLATLVIPGLDTGRFVGLGLLTGCLAGITMKNAQDRKKSR